MAQTASFEIDVATLAAQVSPSKSGALLPNCGYDSKIKLCAASSSVDTVIETERGPKWFDTEQLARLNKEIKKNPGATNWLFQRATLNIGSYRFGDGLSDLNQLLKIAPCSTSALIRRAELYTLAGQYDRALVDLDAAYYWSNLAAPNSGSMTRMESLVLSADVLVRLGKVEQAKAMIERADIASARDSSGFQFAMLKTVKDRVTSARSGLNATEMKEVRTFLEVEFLHTPKCDKIPLLERTIAADFIPIQTLNYLAGLNRPGFAGGSNS